jgi:hypothetical protein
MLLVAGGIFMHNVHQIHDLLQGMPMLLAELLVGLVVGAVALAVEKLIVAIRGAKPS